MEVIAFSMGDSSKTETWSNVPYFFLKALEKENVKVYRCNIRIQDESKLVFWTGKVFNYIIRKMGERGYYSFERTVIYNFLVRRKMLHFIRKFPNADLVLSFDFSSSVADKIQTPTMLFCDWTIEYGCKFLNEHKPSILEYRAIKRQDDTIKNANYVVTLFPNVYDFMKQKFNNIYYLGNVINTVENVPDMESEEEEICDRYKKKNLLFIGRIAYKDALDSLIQAVEQYNREHRNRFKLDVIGIEGNQMNYNNSDVVFHGYLSKNNVEQNKLYYQLIRNAMFVVNTAEKWVGASSIIECAYFGVPFIVTPNADIEKTFGKEIDFGFYSSDNSVQEITKKLDIIASLKFLDYKKMSLRVQKSVADFTWDKYIKKILKLVRNK